MTDESLNGSEAAALRIHAADDENAPSGGRCGSVLPRGVEAA